MAEKLISCNWVDPRRMRQAQPRCWLGMGRRCLSRTGAPVSVGTAAPPTPRTGSAPAPSSGHFAGAGARAARQDHALVCEVTLGSTRHLLCFDGPSAKYPSVVPCPEMDTGSPNAGQDLQSQPGLVHPRFGRNLAQRPACTSHTFTCRQPSVTAMSGWP